MTAINSVIFVGRLAGDVTLRTSDSGTTVAKFRLAVDRPHTKDKVDFFDMAAFNKTAETIEKYLSKGDQIAAECTAQTNEYTDKDGNKRYSVGFVVNRFDFGAKKGGNGSAEKSNAEDNKTALSGSDSSEWSSIPDDEDLPF